MDDTGHSGFTLIELLVTLALVALLAGIAVPAMGRFVDNARLRAAVVQLSGDLQQARNHAINHQRTVYFSLRADTGTWCYGWLELRSCDCRAATGSANHCPNRQSSEDFPQVRLKTSGDAQGKRIRFSPLRGTATATSLQLDNRHRRAGIVVSPLGRIRHCTLAAGQTSC